MVKSKEELVQEIYANPKKMSHITQDGLYIKFKKTHSIDKKNISAAVLALIIMTKYKEISKTEKFIKAP